MSRKNKSSQEATTAADLNTDMVEMVADHVVEPTAHDDNLPEEGEGEGEPDAPDAETPVEAPVAIVSAAEAKRRAKLAEVAAGEAREDRAFDIVSEEVAELEHAETPAQALITARLTAIKADNANLFAGYVYADMLSKQFGALWPTYKLEDIADAGGNEAATLRDFFKEKAAYYEHYKAKFAGIGKRPNPTTSWRRFENYAVAKYNRENGAADKAKDGATRRTPIEALRRDLPALYLRVANADDFNDSPKMQEIGRLLHLTLQQVASSTELQALAEKVGGRKPKV